GGVPGPPRPPPPRRPPSGRARWIAPWARSCSRCARPAPWWWSAPRPRALIRWPAPWTRPRCPTWSGPSGPRAVYEPALRDVVGTIAGDDTVFVATPGPSAALRLERRLRAPLAPARVG